MYSFALIVWVFFAVSSCSSTPYKPNGDPSHGALKGPYGYTPGEAKLLTQVGENYQGVFSPRGDRILFLSRSRPLHEQAQTYELILAIDKEKRVTYHDGENTSAIYGPEGNDVIYVSSTDELKETLSFLKEQRQPQTTENPAPLDGSEIYTSTLSGKNILRLTHRLGFDGQPTLNIKNQELIYVSQSKTHPELMSLQLASGKSRAILQSSQWLVEPHFSPAGDRLAWVEWNPKLDESQIWLSDYGKTLSPSAMTSGPYLHRWPRFHPSFGGVIYSSNENDGKNFELYYASLDGQCKQRLTYHLADDLFPSFSPDGTKVLFTSNRTGLMQLYSMPFRAPACAN